MAGVNGKEIFLNPYVIQMDKFADSLRKLSERFLALEDYKGILLEEESEEIFQRVSEKVCDGCERKGQCLREVHDETVQMVQEILEAVEVYGAELNIELKKKLSRQCLRAPRFLRETLEIYGVMKQKVVWNNKLIKTREGYAGQLNDFAKMIENTTRELDAGIFEDKCLEKKIRNRMKKQGVKVLSSVFYLTDDGKYEIHMTVKTLKGQCVATKELAKQVGQCVGRNMVPQAGECPILGGEYCTVACVEGARYYILQGVAKIGKGCEKISGDTFLLADLPGGKKGAVLSDGMGSGEKAFKESAMMIEMLEELLEAGFPVKTAIQMMNTVFVIGRDTMNFSTMDVSLFDMYSGICEIVKAGAPPTFIKRKNKIEEVQQIALPVGVVHNIEPEVVEVQLESGDYLIMMTDGVLDALPTGRQEEAIKEFLKDTDIQNPGEFAHYLMGKVLEKSGEVPLDDMTILVIGIWKY